MSGPAPVERIWVEAKANCLGLGYGERAWLPVDTPELGPCLDRGLVVRVSAEGIAAEPPPQPQIATGGCRGCGGR